MKLPQDSRTRRYSGKKRPACRISQIGVYSVLSRLRARKKVSFLCSMDSCALPKSVSLPSWVKETEDGVLLSVHVQPSAKREGVVGEFNGRLKIALSAPPVNGKANERLARWLSKTLALPRASITFVAGQTSRDKRLCLRGANAAMLLKRLF